MLVLNELGRREMPSTAEFFRMDEGRSGAFDRLGEHGLLDPRPASFPATDLRAEAEQFVAVGEHHRAVDRGQSGEGRAPWGRARPAVPALRIRSVSLAQVGELSEKTAVRQNMGLGCRIDIPATRQCHSPEPRAGEPPRPCARMETASCTRGSTD